MKVQIIRRDGVIIYYDDVLSLELNEEKGKRVKLVQKNSETTSPFCDFVSVTVLKNNDYGTDGTVSIIG